MTEENKPDRLLGDQIADMIQGPVLKRLARLIQINSDPCESCTRRKRKLNELHAKWKSITGKDFDPENDL